MSSIVTSILSSTVGLLWSKARDSTAAKLNDGDVTDAKIRELIVRELNNIEAKLDGLSRKDLLSSYSFLQEGVDLLNVSLDKSKPEQKAVLKYETQDDLGETSRIPGGVESGILNEALELSRAIGKLKLNSDEDFEYAKKLFKDSRKRAADTFWNEALSINDRIFAARLRIASQILECLERPETAIIGCLSFLKKLHSLPAIQEIFSVYLNGGVKSIFNRAERVENVKSVMLINYVLFQYASKFGSKYSSALKWPTIELADRSFNPILYWPEIATRKSMGEELTQHPNRLLLDEDMAPHPSAVNSHGDVIVVDHGGNVKVISRTCKSKVVELPEPREGQVIKQLIAGLAVDNNNNVYVFTWLEIRTENRVVKTNVLYILDGNYNVKHDCTLDFLDARSMFDTVNIATHKNNNNFIMVKAGDPHVYICDSTGQLKQKFERFQQLDGLMRFLISERAFAFGIPSLSTSEQNEIMITHHKCIRIYTEEGNLKSIVEVLQGHKVRGVAFHYIVCKTIVLTYVVKEDSYFLLCFSETGELETSTFFCKRSILGDYVQITSHPSGPVAVVGKRSITFI